MGNVYSVPRNVKGETRLFVIFSIKSLVFTVVFGLIGFFLFSILSAVGLGPIGIALMIILAIIGYVISSFKIPDIPLVGKFRKASGEMIWEILFKTIMFYKKKKLYIYSKGGLDNEV